MFCGRKTNPRINHVHDGALRIVYRNYIYIYFDEQLNIDKFYNINHENFQILPIGLYKVKNYSSKKIMPEIFEKRQNLDHRLT